MGESVGEMGGKYGNKRAIAPEEEPAVIELYLRVHATRIVADAYGVSNETIRRILKRNDIPRRKPKREKPKARKGNNHRGIDREKVGELYKSGIPVSSIARRFGCSESAVYYHLEKLGLHKIGRRKDANDALIPRIIELLEQGKSYREIAETLGVGRDVVCKRVAKLGLGGGKGSNCSVGGKACAEKRRAAAIKRFESIADRVELVDWIDRDHITVRCVKCGAEFMWYKEHWTMDAPCPECRAVERAKRERKQYELEQQRKAAREWRLSVPRICKECGEPFYSEHENASYCSDECRRKSKNRAASERRKRRGGGCGAYRQRMRIARTPATYDHTVTPGAVYKKYHGRCCACGCMTYRTKEHAPNRATLDHIIALANNGTHTWDNVQLLCSDCNSAKRDLGQMRLPIAV